MIGSWVRAPVGSPIWFTEILGREARSEWSERVIEGSPSRITLVFSLFENLHTRYPGGEIGRHASLRGWCSQGRAGSSPVLGTDLKEPCCDSDRAFSRSMARACSRTWIREEARCLQSRHRLMLKNDQILVRPLSVQFWVQELKGLLG